MLPIGSFAAMTPRIMCAWTAWVLREDSSRQRSRLGEIALAKRRVGLLEYTIPLQAD
jgi:hypothetical protein